MASTICLMSGSLAAIVTLAIRRMNLVQDLFDAVRAGGRLVVLKPEIGDALQPEARANLPPQKRRGPIERLGAVRARLLVAEDGVEDARDLDVWADLHARERHEPDAGIVHFAHKERREL